MSGTIHLTRDIRLEAHMDHARDIIVVYLKYRSPDSMHKRGMKFRISEECLTTIAEEIPSCGEYPEEAMVPEAEVLCPKCFKRRTS